MNHLDDTQFEVHVLDKVRPYKDGGGWELGFDHLGIGCPDDNCKVAPQVGETVKLFGRGFGYTVRGIEIGGRVYRYQTPEEEEEAHRQWVANLRREEQERWEKNKDSLLARVAALPDMFRDRLNGFLEKDPEFATAGMGLGYELFVCEQALEIAKHLGSVGAVEAFRNEGCEQQRVLVPTLDDGHSGNTFGMAVAFAKHYLTAQGKV